MEEPNSTAPEIVAFEDVFDASEQAVLTTVWDEQGPEGKFVKGRHGYTHYVVDGGASASTTGARGGLIILAHGVGTSSHMYRSLARFLVTAGYTVIRYDFFGHGYSKLDTPNIWIPFEPDMYIDQVEDILTVVNGGGGGGDNPQHVEAFVGHSTGGLVGIYAAQRWMASSSSSLFRPKTFILLSPAIYAAKPILARIVDRIPSTFAFVSRYLPFLNFLIADAYTEAGEYAFGKISNIEEEKEEEEKANENTTSGSIYVYPQQQQETAKVFDRLFGRDIGINKHPTLEAGINSCNWGLLRGSQLQGHRDTFRAILQKNEATHNTTSSTSTSTNFVVLWGELDQSVPFKPNFDIVQKWQQEFPNYFKVQPLVKLGHECMFENSEQVGQQMLENL